MDALDFHAGTCECGGGVIQRHNAIRDWLEAWIARLTGRPTDTEEYVVAWNRPAVDAANQPVWEKAAEGPPPSPEGSTCSTRASPPVATPCGVSGSGW